MDPGGFTRTTPDAPTPAPAPEPAPAFGDPAPTFDAPAPPPAKSGKRRQLTIVLGLVVLLIVIVVAGVYFNRDAALNANPGDCVHQTGANDVKIVKCDSTDADFTVLGKVSGKTQSEATGDACTQWKDTTSAYWEGKEGEQGDVLCLKANK